MKECSNCCGDVLVQKVDAWPGSRSHQMKEEVELCLYCRGSHAGNAFFYPEQYAGQASTMRATAAMFNLLDKRLRK